MEETDPDELMTDAAPFRKEEICFEGLYVKSGPLRSKWRTQLRRLCDMYSITKDSNEFEVDQVVLKLLRLLPDETERLLVKKEVKSIIKSKKDHDRRWKSRQVEAESNSLDEEAKKCEKRRRDRPPVEMKLAPAPQYIKTECINNSAFVGNIPRMNTICSTAVEKYPTVAKPDLFGDFPNSWTGFELMHTAFGSYFYQHMVNSTVDPYLYWLRRYENNNYDGPMDLTRCLDKSQPMRADQSADNDGISSESESSNGSNGDSDSITADCNSSFWRPWL